MLGLTALSWVSPRIALGWRMLTHPRSWPLFWRQIASKIGQWTGIKAKSLALRRDKAGDQLQNPQWYPTRSSLWWLCISTTPSLQANFTLCCCSWKLSSHSSCTWPSSQETQLKTNRYGRHLRNIEENVC